MAKGFKHGGGGSAAASLNFKVVGGTSSPSAPAENTIWVNTATEISSWVLSPVQPEAAEGLVWISMGSASAAAFNALKKNGIMIYPIAAKQYVDGAWANNTAEIYQNGAWVKFSLAWDGYYFKDGNQYEYITGGWSTDGWGSYSGSTVVVGDVLSVLTPAAAYVARVGTNDPVDLTDVDTIWFDSPSGKNGHGYPGYLMVCTAKDENSKVASAMISNAGTGSIDVSSLSGPHYLLLRAIGGTTVGDKKGYADIRAIWKEGTAAPSDSGITELRLE